MGQIVAEKGEVKKIMVFAAVLLVIGFIFSYFVLKMHIEKEWSSEYLGAMVFGFAISSSFIFGGLIKKSFKESSYFMSCCQSFVFVCAGSSLALLPVLIWKL